MSNDNFTNTDIRNLFSLRGGGLSGMSLALKARASTAVRQRVWAEARFGKESSAAVGMKAAEEEAIARARILDQEVEETARPVPDVGEGIMGVSGRVTLAGKGAKGFTVAAYSEDGALVGKACTGFKGVFVMEISSGAPFHLVVLNQEGIECFADEAPRPFLAADSIFVTIAIAKDGGPCVDPPDTRPIPDTFRMPDLRKKKKNDALKEITDLRLKIGKVNRQIDRENVGVVERQDPKAGDLVKRGRAVDLWIGVKSAPNGKTKVPGLLELDLAVVGDVLKDAGLTTGKVRAVKNDNPGKVTEQSPAKGTEVDRGSKVNLKIGMSGELRHDGTALAVLFDAQPERASARISGTTVLQRLARNDITTYDQLRRIIRSQNKELADKLGIVDDARLDAIRRAMATALKLAKPIG